jgi:hypothetical protein
MDVSLVLARSDTPEEEIRRDWFQDGHVYEIEPQIYLCPNDIAFEHPLIQSWIRGATLVSERRTLKLTERTALDAPGFAEWFRGSVVGTWALAGDLESVPAGCEVQTAPNGVEYVKVPRPMYEGDIGPKRLRLLSK